MGSTRSSSYRRSVNRTASSPFGNGDDLTNGNRQRQPAAIAVVVIGRPPSLILWAAIFFFLGFVAVLLIGLWMNQMTSGLVWGDPDRPQQMFSYHPFFMVLGLIYIHGFTNLIYRLFPGSSYLGLRIAHGFLQATAIIFVGLGIYAVYFAKSHAKETLRLRHFVSTHSWVGLATVTFVACQWFVGFFGLLVPGFHGRNRARYRKLHRFTGITIFFLGCTTALMGLDQLAKSSVLNLLAYVIILYALLGGYILSNKRYTPGLPEEVVIARADERMPILSTAEAYD